MGYAKAWLKGALVYLGLIAFGWALAFLVGYVVHRGVLSFAALY